MKRNIIFYFIVILIISCIISCKTEKITNFEELKKKYENVEFKNCDEYLKALNETAELYYKEADKIIENKENINDEFLNIQEFLFQLYEQAELFYDDCPKELEKFEIEFDKKMQEKLKNFGIDESEYENLEYDDDKYIEDTEIGEENSDTIIE